MLPAGLAAQLAEPAEQRQLLALHPAAQTVVRLVVGACSCDLVRARHADPLEDERHHRARYRRAARARSAVIADIERHRRGAAVPAPEAGWPRALASFVAEHARNAGATLYLLRFGPEGSREPVRSPARRLRVADVLGEPGRWLEEDVPVVVA